ncbi:MAG TPA: hypothetical protein VI997_04055, partial [Candidatus Thermoplasmatota archaeon]|nr:hypothetical protein [Candidatus Thermoplasmatota archaeon]
APADVDVARALEALKPPARAAPVVLARRAGYRRRARAGAFRSAAALVVLVALAAGVWALAGSEQAEFLGEYAEGRAEPTTESDAATILVPQGLDRVYVVVQPLVRSDGTLTISVLGPRSEVLYQKTFVRGDLAYDDANLEAPPGEWTLVVDYRDVVANVRVKLTGVREA